MNVSRNSTKILFKIQTYYYQTIFTLIKMQDTFNFKLKIFKFKNFFAPKQILRFLSSDTNIFFSF